MRSFCGVLPSAWVAVLIPRMPHPWVWKSMRSLRISSRYSTCAGSIGDTPWAAAIAASNAVSDAHSRACTMVAVCPRGLWRVMGVALCLSR